MYRKLLFVSMMIAVFAIAGCSKQETPISASGADSEFQTYVENVIETEDYDLDYDFNGVGKSRFEVEYINSPTVITESGVYRVGDDFNASEDGIVVRADYVILLLGKHTITGPGDDMGHGIVIDNAEKVVVFDGMLENFGIGVFLNHAAHSMVRYVEINGADRFADPANGIIPQIGIMLINSSNNFLIENKINMINLGIFVRGAGSEMNKVYRNHVMGGDRGLLAICYNPAPDEGTAGPQKDFVFENKLERFGAGIQTSAGSMHNKFVSNHIKFFNEAYRDFNGSNVFRDNMAMQIDGPSTEVLTLEFDGLGDLGPDYVYEGWVIVAGSPVSTGTFTVDSDGNLNQMYFNVAAPDLMMATKFVLTIEPADDPDPAPSSTHYLAGDFADNSAPLSTADPAALGSDFLAATGPFILNTPSTGSDDTDYHAGIWWLDPAAGFAATLDLPTLPAGWEYEGWVVGSDGPVTTGKFTDVNAADFDGAGPTSGPDGFPPFPGQDYINPLMSLIGFAAVITVEPMPDNSASPFALKPLLDGNIEDVGIGVIQPMMNNAASFPTGTASK